jgi:DDE superfamily endonuclease
MQAKQLWSLWQALLAPFACCFTRCGFRRFVTWVTGLVCNSEEHTITQSLIALDRTQDWRKLESFAEYGSWDRWYVERALTRQLADAPGHDWHGYRLWAGDDTKVHRCSKNVWGTCTFHEYTARCPNRASTVRAPNWVVVGALLRQPDQPAWFLPTAGRLYFRKAQLPDPGSTGGPPVSFRTKNELLVEMARLQARTLPGRHLLAVDGAFAVRSVLRPLACPGGNEPRIDVVTRGRGDARLHALPPLGRRPGQKGPSLKWGRRLAPPRQGGRWPGAWRHGEAFLYGRRRQVRWKEVCCLWRPLGPDLMVKAVVAEVEGYRQRFTLLSTALDLTGLQLLEGFCARFREEDGFRDLKQRLGWEECRAWTRHPIERTTQALFVSMTMLRLLQFRLEASGETDWWLRPPWNRRKVRPSVLDLERLWEWHRAEIQRCLAAWLESEEKPGSEDVAEVVG